VRWLPENTIPKVARTNFLCGLEFFLALAFSKIPFPKAPPPARIVEGRTPKEKRPFLFQKESRARKSEKQGAFSFDVRRGSARRAAGRNWSVGLSFASPRAPRVAHLFWK
jgi:hypothetical protein